MVAAPLVPEQPPALIRPVILEPAAREISYGTVVGRVGPGTARIVVKVGGAVKVDVPMRSDRLRRGGTPFGFRVDIPPRNVAVQVTAFDLAGNSASAQVSPVFGLPRAGQPVAILSREDAILADRVRALARGYPGISGIFVQDLRTGRGAAWNARARFQAASTLKLGIAVEVLRVLGGKPRPGTRVEELFRKMLVYSSNKAANDLEIWLAGSMNAGAARVTATLGALGLSDSHMYGGYIIGTASGRPIPLRVERQPPYFTLGKYGTAWDLARLHRFVHRASVGLGPLIDLPGRFTAADARYLLFTLAHVRDPGKLDRFVGEREGVAVLHKAGWIIHARHDTGLVFWPGGGLVVAVMTWHDVEAGVSSDILAGRVAAIALNRFSAYRREPHAWLLRS